MANVNWPRGLRPYRDILRRTEYTLASGLAQDLFIGDPVAPTGTGRNVTIATAGTTNPILGAILAVYDLDKVPLQYWNSGHTGVGYVVVADHPDQWFVIEDNGTSYGINGANGNVNLVSGTGSTVYYLSGWELNGANTPGATAGDQIRLIRPVDTVDNDITLANADWIVKINNHYLNAGIVGVGV